MRRYRTALFLFGVLFALGGLATWDEWRTQQEDEDKKTKNRLTNAKAEDVVEVRYSTIGSPAVEQDDGTKPPLAPFEATIVKRDAQWQLTEPMSAPAESGSVDNLIKTILEYSYAKPVAETKDRWKEFGLEHSARKITLKFAEATGVSPLTVFVGDKSPVGYSVYIRTDRADTVYLGSQHLLTATAKTLFELRDKSIVKIDEPNVKFFEYVRKGQDKIELAKIDGNYRITKPIELEADSAAVRDFLEDIDAAKAVGFIDSAPLELTKAFESPDVIVTWSDSNANRKSLKFAEFNGKFVAMTSPEVDRYYELAADFRAKVRKDLIDFRNRRILAIDVADANEVEIDGAKYVNSNGEWFAAEQLGKAGAKEAVHIRAFLVDLEFAKTDRFLSPDDVKEQLAKAPENRITISFKKPDSQSVSLELFATADSPDKFLVKRSGVMTVYRVPKSAFNSMRPSSTKAAAEGTESVEMPGSGDDKPDLDLGADEIDVPNG